MLDSRSCPAPPFFLRVWTSLCATNSTDDHFLSIASSRWNAGIAVLTLGMWCIEWRVACWRILYLLDGIGIIAERRRAGNRVLLPNDNISDWLVCWRVQKPLEKLASPHGRLFYPFCVRTSFFRHPLQQVGRSRNYDTKKSIRSPHPGVVIELFLFFRQRISATVLLVIHLPKSVTASERNAAH